MILTWRTIPTTTIWSRDPVGRKYLATEDGKILTTEDWKWIIAIDNTPTQLTSNRGYTATTLWEIGGTLAWMSWTLSDYYTGILPTYLSWRVIPT